MSSSYFDNDAPLWIEFGDGIGRKVIGHGAELMSDRLPPRRKDSL